MVKKSLLFLLTMFITLPAFSGEFENAMSKGHNIFLYLYSPRCKYCTMFTPTYKQLEKSHDGEFVFIKTDSTTAYGKELMYEFHAGFVPYVIMINSQKKIAAQITPDCLIDKGCVEKSMKNFRSL